MREIKFRAWDRENKEFFFYSSLVITLDGKIVFKPRHGPVEDHDPQNERFELQQYTGLKDKNGKEIYEGDIFLFGMIHWLSKVIGIVEWDQDGALFKITPVNQEYGRGTIRMNGPQHDTVFYHEVIGNIYENPELVKGDK